MWTTITVDVAKRLLFVSTGNPTSDFDRSRRRGADLYTNSVVVLDADSGTLRWYVQQNPDDEHDWDTAAAPTIYTIHGRDLMAVGSKDGQLYLYNRDTHQLLARTAIATRFNADVELSYLRATRVCPGVSGGVEWNGPAVDVSNALLFVNSVDWCATLTPQKPADAETPVGGSWKMDPPGRAHGWLQKTCEAHARLIARFEAEAGAWERAQRLRRYLRAARRTWPPESASRRPSRVSPSICSRSGRRSPIRSIAFIPRCGRCPSSMRLASSTEAHCVEPGVTRRSGAAITLAKEVLNFERTRCVITLTHRHRIRGPER